MPAECIEWSRQQTLREISVALSGSRHVGDSCYAFTKSRVFVVRKEECPVAHNWPAYRPSALLAVVCRRLFISRSEDIARIQSSGSEESVSGTVQGVCSGLRDDTDLTAGVPSKRSIVAVGEHFKFTNGIDRQANTGSVQLRVDVVNAVEEKSLEHPRERR